MVSTDAAARRKVATAGARPSGQMRSLVGGKCVSTPVFGGQTVFGFGFGADAGVDFYFDVCDGVCW